MRLSQRKIKSRKRSKNNVYCRNERGRGASAALSESSCSSIMEQRTGSIGEGSSRRSSFFLRRAFSCSIWRGTYD